MMKIKKSFVYFVIRFIVSACLIGFFFNLLAKKEGGFTAAIHNLWRSILQSSVGILLIAFCLHLVGFLLISWRWQKLLITQNVQVKFKQLFIFYIMASFFNTFLPSTIGGDALRIIESKRIIGSGSRSFIVVLVERLSGMFALVFISFVAVIIKLWQTQNNRKGLFAMVLLLMTISVVIYLIVCPGFWRLLKKILPKIILLKIGKFIDMGHESILLIRQNRKKLFQVILISLAFQFFMVVYYYLIALALKQPADFLDFLMKIPLMILLLMIVPAINGLGIRTASFRGMMKFPEAYALAGEMLDLTMRVIYGMMGGIIFIFYKRINAKNNNV